MLLVIQMEHQDLYLKSSPFLTSDYMEWERSPLKQRVSTGRNLRDMALGRKNQLLLQGCRGTYYLSDCGVQLCLEIKSLENA